MNASQRRSKWSYEDEMRDIDIVYQSLRRRFEQNQEDCAFTVLAILPTAVDNIFEALPVEQLLEELQQQRAERLAKSVGPSEVSTADLPSAPPSTIDNGDEKSLASESFVHTSQMADSAIESSPSKLKSSSLRPKKNKTQLWNQMKIDCMSLLAEAAVTLANTRQQYRVRSR
jgi:peroxin-3